MRQLFLFLLLFALVLNLAACSAAPASLPSPLPVAPSITPTLPLTVPTPGSERTPFTFSTPLNTTIPSAFTPTPAAIQDITRLAMVDEQIGWAVAQSPRLLLRTTDGGSTWRDVTPDPAFDPDGVYIMDARMAWVPLEALIYRTVDGGRSWDSSPVPFKKAALQFSDPNTGIAIADPICGAGTCYVSLYYTADGGQSWALIPLTNPTVAETPPAAVPPGAAHILKGDSFRLTSPTLLWMGGNGIVAGPVAVLLRSRDAGKSWVTQRIPLPAAGLDSGLPNAVDLPVFFSPNDGYFTAKYYLTGSAGGNAALAVYVTHDAGQTWEALPAAVQDVPWSENLVFISQQDFVVRCGATLCVTHDGARSWAPIPGALPGSPQAGGALLAYDFATPTSGWAYVRESSSTQALYRTRDGGLTWKALRLSLLSK